MSVEQTIKAVSADVGQAREIKPLRPFYFYVVFWGEQFRDYFLDLCLPSLLSPENIPALTGGRANRLLIATTREDWEKVRTAPIFREAMDVVEPVWIEMPRPGPDESKMRVMSQGQLAAVRMAYHDGAYGVVLAPDLVLSDGSVAALERLALEGKRLVLAVALRFSMDPIVATLKSRGLMRPGEPMSLPARELMEIALPNLHSEILRFEWDAAYFADFPISCYRKVPNGDGIAVWSFSWAPMLIDYGSLDKHHTETLEHWTLDGDYVHQNFPQAGPRDEDVHVVTDSDELSFVSMTSEQDLTYYPLKKEWVKSASVIGEWTKGYFLDKAYNNDVFDDLKRRLFLTPVRLHTGRASGAWDEVEKAMRLIFWTHINSNIIDEEIMNSPDSYNFGDAVYFHALIPRPKTLLFFFTSSLYCISICFYIAFRAVRFVLTLLFVYCGIIIQVVRGNQTDRDRVRRHIGLVQDSLGTGQIRDTLGSLSHKAANFYAHARFRRLYAPKPLPTAYFIIKVPRAPFTLVAAFFHRMWCTAYCAPRRLWNVLSPYMRVLMLAGLGGRSERERIRRRAGLVLSGVAARFRSRA